MDPQEHQQHRSWSPPPGLEAIHRQMQPSQPTQRTDDFETYPPQKPRIQIMQGIPANATVTIKSNPYVRCRPNDGPLGFGFYKETDEDRDVINFYPVTGIAQYLHEEHHAGHPVPGYSKQSTSRVKPFPAPPPPPDIIDPKWIAWYNDSMTIDPMKISQPLRQKLIEENSSAITPLHSRLRRPQAEKYRKALMKKAEEIYPEAIEETNARNEVLSEWKGMRNDPDIMKPVSYLDGVTDWRKDPCYKQRQRLEERKKLESEGK